MLHQKLLRALFCPHLHFFFCYMSVVRFYGSLVSHEVHIFQVSVMVRQLSTYTLVKFSVSSSCHGWIVPSIYLGNMISFNFVNLIHGNISCKWYLTANIKELLTCK